MVLWGKQFSEFKSGAKKIVWEIKSIFLMCISEEMIQQDNLYFQMPSEMGSPW